jgi:hypothetical protein
VGVTGRGFFTARYNVVSKVGSGFGQVQGGDVAVDSDQNQVVVARFWHGGG